MRPPRFILSLVGIALFLAIGTLLILSAVGGFNATMMLNGSVKAGTVLGLVLLAVLVMRAALLWADNRKQGR